MTRNGHAALLRNFLYAVFTKFGVRLIGLVSIAVLARLLTPQDFGFVAPALALLAIFEVFAIAGIKQMIVREKELSDEFVNSGWTIGVVVNSAMALVMVAVGGPILELYMGTDGIWLITSILALYLIIDSFENPGLFLMERAMQFKRILVLRTLARIFAALITIGSAALFQDYRALLVGVLAYQTLLTGASHFVTDFKPGISLSAWRRLTKPSLLMTSSNALRSFTNSGERLVLSSSFTVGDIGLLSVGRDFVRMMTVEIAGALNDVILPSLTSATKVEEGYGASRQMSVLIISSSFVAVPVGFGLCILAEPIVRLILGDQWVLIVGWVQVLAIGGIYAAISEIGVIALVAVHTEKRNALTDLMHCSLFCCLLLFVMMNDKSILFLVTMFSILQALTCCTRLYNVLPFMSVSWLQLAVDHLIAVTSALLMSGALVLLERVLEIDGMVVLALIPVGVAIYMLSLSLLIWKLRRNAISGDLISLYFSAVIGLISKKHT